MSRSSAIASKTTEAASRLASDSRGIVATEFAVIAPVMILLFFGAIELTSGIAVDRKVTLVARTLSDLTSQTTKVSDDDLKNIFSASYGVLTPYPVTPVNATVTEIYVDASNVAKVQWSKSATVGQSGSTISVTLTNSTRNKGDVMPIPAGLAVSDTYLIFSEVSYLFTPAIGYVVKKAGVNLTDANYTRPRQSKCVLYPSGTQTVCPN